MSTKYILYYKTNESDTFIAFLGLLEDVKIEEINHQFLVLSIEKEDFDINQLRQLSAEELYTDMSSFLLPVNEYLDVEMVMLLLPKLGLGSFDIADLIAMIGKTQNTYKDYFKDLYVSMFGWETIDSILGFVENDLNASKTSKNLYMHRNTLNYRLDHFEQKSGLFIRHFKGAFAFYLLFS
ncbi:MAG: helix-turn-helix domain-containing protein [Candidatus Izemoplasmatales bacterium]